MPQKTINLRPEFKDFLRDTGIPFSSRYREHVYLEDLFIFPDLRIIQGSSEEINQDTKSERILDYDNHVLIFGDEQSGKTTLAKKVFIDAFESGFFPLLIEGEKYEALMQRKN
ncbi:MAG: hypothetical protein O3A14_08865 [Cyanobacteria bacterium]|nr:hypothetical protein [Cyanobacteriota bacterium]